MLYAVFLYSSEFEDEASGQISVNPTTSIKSVSRNTREEASASFSGASVPIYATFLSKKNFAITKSIRLVEKI